jgi:hypothetical protein
MGKGGFADATTVDSPNHALIRDLGSLGSWC